MQLGEVGEASLLHAAFIDAQQPGQDSCTPIQDSKFDFVAAPRRLHLSRTLPLLFPTLMQGSGGSAISRSAVSGLHCY